MNRLVVAFLVVCSALNVNAQTFQPKDFIYPLQGAAKLYSANFGEFRPDHFHAGIDIKTDGVEGKKVVAAADGYISRISMSPYGYGLALYVAHPNGTTSVYAHLSEFMKSVSDYVEAERYRSESQSVNLYCKPNQFVVKQGDVIALSGNSGGSGGPHLHFEIRDSATQEPINIVAQKIITPRDNIAPLMMRLHYIETAKVQGVTRKAARRSFDLVKDGSSYVIAGGGSISVGREGYFVIEASDRRNDVYNTFGLYQVIASLDDKEFFKFSMDRFSYSNTRYCNAIGYYPVMIHSRNEVVRLSAAENCDMSHYRTLVDRGVVSLNAGESKSVKIVVKDDCGNSSQLNFSVRGKADDALFVAEAADPKMIAYWNKQFVYKGDNITVSMPAKCLYESAIFSCNVTEPKDSTIFSKVYEVMNYETPLHKAMTVSIAASVPYELQSKVGVVCISRSGRPSFVGGKYRLGSVSASTRNAGKFYVAADVKAPFLKPGIEEGSDQRGSRYFTCQISDDLSGVASYKATLDGEWIALNLDKGKLYHTFRQKPNGAEHTLVITAVDGVGNKTVVTRKFIR